MDISQLANFGVGNKIFIPSGLPQRTELTSSSASYTDIVNLPSASGIITCVLCSVSQTIADIQIELEIDGQTSVFTIDGGSKNSNNFTAINVSTLFDSNVEESYTSNVDYLIPFTQSMRVRQLRLGSNFNVTGIVYYQLGNFVELN